MELAKRMAEKGRMDLLDIREEWAERILKKGQETNPHGIEARFGPILLRVIQRTKVELAERLAQKNNWTKTTFNEANLAEAI